MPCQRNGSGRNQLWTNDKFTMYITGFIWEGAVVGKSPVSDLASHWIEGWLLPGLMSFKLKKKRGGNICLNVGKII